MGKPQRQQELISYSTVGIRHFEVDRLALSLEVQELKFDYEVYERFEGSYREYLIGDES